MKKEHQNTEMQNTEPQKAKEPTVSIYLPAETTGPFLEGAINGVTFRIPAGRIVEVPKRIADVIRESRSSLQEGERAVAAFRDAGGRKLG